MGDRGKGPAADLSHWAPGLRPILNPREADLIRYFGASRRTSRGALSSRSPLNAGCRARPSRVHWVNSTSQTSYGSAHFASLASARGTAMKGGVSRLMHWSAAIIERPSWMLYTVPTLPAHYQTRRKW